LAQSCDTAGALDSQDSLACCDFFIRVGFEPNRIDRTCVLLEIYALHL
jgi:hypothetical protein